MRSLRIFYLLVALAAIGGISANPSRIIGGSVTTINVYPFGAALLHSWNGINFVQSCGASILNYRSLLTAAHCFMYDNGAFRWRTRLGSSFASSGGTVYNSAQIIEHPGYDLWTTNNDVAIVRTATPIVYINNAVQPSSIAGVNYNLADNSVVWAIGWGLTAVNGQPSEQLRHVQIWTVNQNVCRQRYAQLGVYITDNMLCAGWLDIGGRDQCTQDSGGSLLHNHVVVGICSSGQSCATAIYPGVNARVSRFTSWIQVNA